MNTLPIAWMALPFLAGFTIFIIPQLDRFLATLTVVASVAFAAKVVLLESPLALQFLDEESSYLMVSLVLC